MEFSGRPRIERILSQGNSLKQPRNVKVMVHETLECGAGLERVEMGPEWKEANGRPHPRAGFHPLQRDVKNAPGALGSIPD